MGTPNKDSQFYELLKALAKFYWQYETKYIIYNSYIDFRVCFRVLVELLTREIGSCLADPTADKLGILGYVACCPTFYGPIMGNFPLILDLCARVFSNYNIHIKTSKTEADDILNY